MHQIIVQKPPQFEVDLLYILPPRHPPEHALLIAIIERAGRDAWGKSIGFLSGKALSDEHKRTIRNRARCWLYNLEIYPWSYAWMCEHLGIEPMRLAQAMKDKFSFRDD